MTNDIYWSKYVHVLYFKGKTCLYHSLNFNVVIINQDISINSPISSHDAQLLGNELIESLLSLGLIVVDPSSEYDYLNELKRGIGDIHLSNLNLLIANSCNMDCKYCQICHNIVDEKEVLLMSEATAKTALSYFFDRCDVNSDLTINITGGEPLLNKATLEFILGFIADNSTRVILEKIRKVIFTNGTLLTPEIAKLFRQHDVFVIVSLDGNADTHDILRKYINGSSTYPDALRGYNNAKEAGCTCAISSVYSPDMNLNSFKEWAIELNPSSIGLNYPHQILGHSIFDVDFESYSRAIIRLHDELNKHEIYLENYERYRRSFTNKTIKTRECQACGRGMTVDARGKVGVCKSLLVSDVISSVFDNDFDISHDPNFSLWAKRTPLDNNDCLECVAIGICGGGCAYDSYIINKTDFMKNDIRMCVHIKNILIDILYQLSKKRLLKNEYWIYSRSSPNQKTKFETVGH